MLECKVKEYHIYQMIAEMSKSVGDIGTKSLIKGDLVRDTDIFGLAVNYEANSAKLVKLHINFEDNKSTTIVSEEPATYHSAFCWLLNAIML